jgi:hypothetical protein
MGTVRFEIDADEDLADLVKELQEFAPKRLPRAIARTLLPTLQRQLDTLVDTQLVRREPPPRGEGSPPFVWSNDPVKNARARRGFFARYPNGYQRTGQLAKAWQGDIVFDAPDGVITIGVDNPSAAASYVYGAEEYNFEQVPGHATTGWPNSGVVVPDILLDIGTQLDDGLDDLINTEIAKL